MTPVEVIKRMTVITLIRHGLVDNPEGVYYGRLPGFPLAEEGRVQAAAAGSYLVGESIAAVYHSPMLRAFQTADIVRAHCAIHAPLFECRLLNEIYSAYDGHPVAEMERRDWNFYEDISAPYEKPAEIATRMVDFFEQVRRKHPGQHVVGVSHADPIAFAILWANERPLTAEQRKRLDECGVPDSYPSPASISTFTFSDDDRRLVDFRYFAPRAG